MLTITMKTDSPREAADILQEVLEKEALRLKYGLDLARRHLKHFEKKYNVSSEISDYNGFWGGQCCHSGQNGKIVRIFPF